MRSITSLLSGVALALITGVSLHAQDAAILRKADHDQLAKVAGAYFKVLDEGEGEAKALEAIQKVLDTFDKRSGASPTLSLVRDWERVFTLAMAPSGSGKKGISSVDFEIDKVKFKYALSVPKEYSRATPAPLMLVIPDAGKKPAEVIDQGWVDPALKEKLILAVCAMPADAKLWAEFGDEAAPGGMAVALRVLANLRSVYAIDSNRIFVCGMGAGVPAAGRLAASFPHLFAGAIGRGGDLDKLSAANFRALPTLWTGGGANCTAFAEENEKLGDKNCTVDAGANEAKIWEWIQAHQRVPSPFALRLSPLHARNGKAYWMSVDRFDPDAKEKPVVEVKADRATNKVVVTGAGAEQVQLWFNDVLVDMSKPIEVVLNGESHKIEPKRSLKTMLRRVYDTSDTSWVYTANESFLLPKPQKGDAKKP